MDLKKQASGLAQYGRNGDTILAHINKDEAALLEALGGSGTINPETGLPEYWGISIGGWNPVSWFQDEVIDPVGNALTGAVEGIGDAAIGILEPIGEAATNVVSGVGNTLASITEDPRKLAMVALSAFAPGAGTALGTAMGLSGAAASVVGNAIINTAINGGDVKSALIAAAIPQVGLQGASLAADQFEALGLDKAVADTAGKIVSQTGVAAATGRDPVQALISGGISQALPEITSQIEGFDKLSPAVQRAVNRAVATTLMGGDPSQQLVAAALGAGKDAMKMAGIEESIAPNSSPLGNTPTNDEILSNIGYVPEPVYTDYNDLPKGMDTNTGEFAPPVSAGLPSSPEPVFTDYLSTPPVVEPVNTDYNDLPVGMNSDTGEFIYGDHNDIPAGMNPDTGQYPAEPSPNKTSGLTPSVPATKNSSTSTTNNETSGLSYLNQQKSIDFLPKFFDVKDAWLKTTKPTQQNTGLGLQPLKQISDQPDSGDTMNSMFAEGGSVFDAIDPDLLDILTTRMPYYADGGDVNPFTNMLDVAKGLSPNLVKQTPMFLKPQGQGKPLQLQALKQINQNRGMAKGGLPSKYEEAAPEGHHPEFITGLTGYYAGGRGTGQSDDIPAMLHDGDYVMDAEAVSALGDGSSKAGKEVLTHFMHQVPHQDRQEGNPVPAKIADGEFVLPAAFVTALGGGDNKHGSKLLDEMREKLREHKRAAPLSKIPPKAKSPLEYLSGVKG